MIFILSMALGWLGLSWLIFTALNGGGVDQPVLALGSAILAAMLMAFVGAAI